MFLLDEVFLSIGSQRYYLWRAVDQDGDVIDILLQKRRNAAAAKGFFRKLLKGQLTMGIMPLPASSFEVVKMKGAPSTRRARSASTNSRHSTPRGRTTTMGTRAWDLDVPPTIMTP